MFHPGNDIPPRVLQHVACPCISETATVGVDGFLARAFLATAGDAFLDVSGFGLLDTCVCCTRLPSSEQRRVFACGAGPLAAKIFPPLPIGKLSVRFRHGAYVTYFEDGLSRASNTDLRALACADQKVFRG